MRAHTHTHTYTHLSRYCASQQSFVVTLQSRRCQEAEWHLPAVVPPRLAWQYSLLKCRDIKKMLQKWTRNVCAPCCVSLPAFHYFVYAIRCYYFIFPSLFFCIILVSAAAFFHLPLRFLLLWHSMLLSKCYLVWCFLYLPSPSSSSFSYWFQFSTLLYIFWLFSSSSFMIQLTKTHLFFWLVKWTFPQFLPG